MVAEELRKSMNQSFVVENIAGADGYTLLVNTNSAHGINPAVYNSLPYDPEKDFEPVSGLNINPLLLVVNKDFPANDVAGLLAIARERGAARPLIFGNGNTSSLVAAQQLKVSGKIAITNVPYRSTPQRSSLVAG